MGVIIPSSRNRVIRGIRDSIASGSVIGRASSGDGPAELIPLSDLARSMVAANFVAAPSNLSAEMDVLFGAAEGSLIQRGPSVWQGLSPGSANQVLSSGGASALNAWESLSALLDAVFGSTRGMILYRGASGWAALAAGANGFLQTQNTSADPRWFNPFTGGPTTGDLAVFSGGGGSPTLTNGAFSGDVSVVNIAGSLITTLANSGVTAGTYGDATHSPRIVVDAKGRITSASNVAITASPSSIALTDGHILVGNGSNVGADVAMSGDVAISDTGATTIQSNAVTTSKINNSAVTLAKIANASGSSKVLGSGASGAGSAYTELSLGSGLAISGSTLSASGASGGGGGYEAASAGTPKVASFSWLNQGDAAATDGTGSLVFHGLANAATNLRCLIQSAPATPYSIYLRAMPVAAAAATISFGLMLYNSTSGRILTHHMQSTNTTQLLNRSWQRWTNTTTFNATIQAVQQWMYSPWFRIDVTSTTATPFLSPNGWDWGQSGTAETLSTFITATGGSVDKIGMSIQVQNGEGFFMVNAFQTTAPT